MTSKRSKRCTRILVQFGAALAFLLLAVPSGRAVDLDQPPELTAQQINLSTTAVAMSNPESTQEELPGLGHKFELIGAMMDDHDPENATNDTISDLATPTTFALAYRNLPPGIKIAALDSQLGFKYFFMGRSCGGGSPRLTLLIDADGDGRFVQVPTGPDFAIHGHVSPPWAGCPSNQWVYENLTDNQARWEVTPCGPVVPGTTCPFQFNTWDSMESGITVGFPNHKVLAGFLVDDSCSFFVASCGEAHYDLVTIENRTLENDQDTV